MAGKLFEFVNDNYKHLRYIFPEETPNAKQYALNGYASFFILLNSLIPLAMIVTLELSKLYYTYFIENDAEFISID